MATKQFGTIEELREIIATLDRAEERPVYVGDNLEEEYKGIWNLGTDSLSVIASEGYSLVDHQEAFGLVADGLEGKNFYGTILNHHDYVSCEVFFPDIQVKDDEQGIDLGMKVVNSYNRTASFKGHATAMRLVCENGMYMKKIIPDLQFAHIHVGMLGDEIDSILETFFHNLEESTEAIQKVLDMSMTTFIEFDSLAQVQATFETILRSPFHAKRVMPFYQAVDELNPSKWEVYNAITAYITHADVVPSRVDIYSNWAENLLLPTVTLVPTEMPEPEFEENLAVEGTIEFDENLAVEGTIEFEEPVEDDLEVAPEE